MGNRKMTTQEIADVLHRTDIFSLVSNALLLEIIPELTVQDYGADERIIQKGEAGDKLFVLIAGKAKIHDEAHTLATVEAGSYFGEFFLFDTAPRSMSVSAVGDVLVIAFNRDAFKKILEQHPQIYNKIISLLIKRLRDQNNNTISILKSREQELLRLVEERTHELNLKTQELAIKNREVTDNIVYAQRIQSAILPDRKLIAQSFADSFVLYMPKDIVSGDFYSFFLKNDRAIVVAADCTGHGVTGAFMSMIGSSLLNQIIIEKGVTQPSLILDELHLAVIHSLRQSENESHDGMDVAICAFDVQCNSVEYAGANRPLWLMKNNELQTIKADKVPIGGTQIFRTENYTNHTIALSPSDTIYIFTDGYADQFGGELGKKMMTAKFKELLLSIQQLSMPEQETALKEFFMNWKNNHEQVDDVLVMGMRV